MIVKSPIRSKVTRGLEYELPLHDHMKKEIWLVTRITDKYDSYSDVTIKKTGKQR